MSNNPSNTAIFRYIELFYGQNESDFSLPELSSSLAEHDLIVPDRTLRRWLTQWVEQGLLRKTGQKRGTRYFYQRRSHATNAREIGFLQQIEPAKRQAISEQLRDLWTHGSTAIEGNSLSLGDTHSILEYGLTVSGKPLREHHEVVGHSRAIDILYQLCGSGYDSTALTKQHLFKLHKAVQLEVVMDIYAPVGEWKVEKNYANSVTSSGQALIIEYAAPGDVDALMTKLIETINDYDLNSITFDNAHQIYAELHLALVHVHPFADGNGRIARLVANLPLLKAGLPPLLLNKDKRREYITLLADYQSDAGTPKPNSSGTIDLWPEPANIAPFAEFCRECHQSTLALLS